MPGWKSYGKNKREMGDSSESTSDKLAEVQNEIDASKHTVSRAIHKTVERGDKIDDVLDKAEDMRLQGEVFNKNSKKARREFLQQNIKIKVICCVSIIIVIFVVFFVAIYPEIK